MDKKTTGAKDAPKQVKEHEVNLVAIRKNKDAKEYEKTFPIARANALLKLPNSKWELSDKNYTWNGKEIEPK